MPKPGRLRCPKPLSSDVIRWVPTDKCPTSASQNTGPKSKGATRLHNKGRLSLWTSPISQQVRPGPARPRPAFSTALGYSANAARAAMSQQLPEQVGLRNLRVKSSQLNARVFVALGSSSAVSWQEPQHLSVWQTFMFGGPFGECTVRTNFGLGSWYQTWE